MQRKLAFCFAYKDIHGRPGQKPKVPSEQAFARKVKHPSSYSANVFELVSAIAVVGMRKGPLFSYAKSQ